MSHTIYIRKCDYERQIAIWILGELKGKEKGEEMGEMLKSERVEGNKEVDRAAKRNKQKKNKKYQENKRTAKTTFFESAY